MMIDNESCKYKQGEGDIESFLFTQKKRIKKAANCSFFYSFGFGEL